MVSTLPFLCKSLHKKGKVEALAKFTSRLDPYNYECDSIEELCDKVKEITDDINNENSRATGKTPNQLWQKKKEYLLSLPNQDILDSYLTTPLIRKVSKESMIVYNNQKYSLPIKYTRKVVEIKVLNDILYILNEGIVIDKHKISNKPFNYKEEHIVRTLWSPRALFQFQKVVVLSVW